MQLQQTLKKKYSFEGKGLHTGRYAHMTVCPAPENTGIMFVRTDAENATVAALAENVSNTTRSTTISQNGVSVSTIEHILSALWQANRCYYCHFKDHCYCKVYSKGTG